MGCQYVAVYIGMQISLIMECTCMNKSYYNKPMGNTEYVTFTSIVNQTNQCLY